MNAKSQKNWLNISVFVFNIISSFYIIIIYIHIYIYIYALLDIFQMKKHPKNIIENKEKL